MRTSHKPSPTCFSLSELRRQTEVVRRLRRRTEMPTERKKSKQHKPLPAPNSDFYQFAEDLPAEEMAIVKKVRDYMETKVQPIINKYRVEDSFPFELLPSSKELGIAGMGIN